MCVVVLQEALCVCVCALYSGPVGHYSINVHFLERLYHVFVSVNVSFDVRG